MLKRSGMTENSVTYASSIAEWHWRSDEATSVIAGMIFIFEIISSWTQRKLFSRTNFLRYIPTYKFMVILNCVFEKKQPKILSVSISAIFHNGSLHFWPVRSGFDCELFQRL